MSVIVRCKHCGAQFRAAKKFLGRRAKCLKCHKEFAIQAAEDSKFKADSIQQSNGSIGTAKRAPGASRSSPGRATPPAPAKPARDATAPPAPVARKQRTRSSPQPQDQSRRILAAFEGPIEPVRSNLLYRFNILIVAAAMLLLPLAYVALIGLAGYGVYYHAVNHTEIVRAVSGSGRAQLMACLFYLAPVAVGPILIVFMIKPLFASPSHHEKSRSVTREGEPLLFAFVDRVCHTVGAPPPKRIDLDCQVNASASFRRGVVSFLGNDLVLTIGLPLVAGLNLRQFAGVLAHEFGHFSQGAGMRLSFVVRSISHWFLRVVYERDTWDVWLAQAAAALDFRLAWVLYLAMLVVWITRKVLWLLMWIGFLMSSSLLRQMEFDADRYEARLAGSDAFASTVRRLMVLNLAMQQAQDDLSDYYQEGRLGDDVPALVAANAAATADEVHQRIDEAIAQAKSGLFDTHPTDRDRVANARAEAAPGVFKLEIPATKLFRDFHSQSKATTWEWYRAVFGNDLDRNKLHPVEGILAKQRKDAAIGHRLRRYFQGTWSAYRPLSVNTNALVAPDELDRAADELQTVRQSIVVAAPAARKAVQRFGATVNQTIEATQAAAMFRGGQKIPSGTFHVEFRSTEHAKRFAESSKRRTTQANHDLRDFDQTVGRRLQLALQLLQVPQLEQRISDVAERRRRSGHLVHGLNALSGQLTTILELLPDYSALATILGKLQGNESNQRLIGAITSLMEKLHPPLCRIREILLRADYPFDHVHHQLTLGQYLLPTSPSRENLGEIYSSLEQLFDRLPILLGRLSGELAEIAEAVEDSLGMPPLTEPERDEPAAPAEVNAN